MRIPGWIGAALLGVVSLSGCARERPPDLLLVTLDTTRVDALGCYGGASARTPHLDALAAGGVRFAQAITPTPYTGPAHASLLTGLYPPRHGLRDFLHQTMDGGVATLPDLLRVRGYRTAAFLSSYVLDRRFGLARGFDVYSCDFWRQVTGGGDPRIVLGTPEFERRGQATVDEALAWLARAGEKDAPIFTWVHLYDPHLPYAPEGPFAPREEAADPIAAARARYYGEVSYADAQVGRLLDWLREAKREDHTIVVVTADHGELLGEHGRTLGTHSTHLVDATVHVPLIVRVPGLPARVVPEQVRLVDVLPTLLDLLRMGLPAGLDGRSLVPLLQGAPLADVPAYSETFYERFPEVAPAGAELVALREGAFKLLRSPVRRELYDLDRDPDELQDVGATHPDLVAGLEAELRQVRRVREAPDAPLSMDEEERQRHLERLRSLGYAK
ncbi:MAG TPA: sulfatase [Candidatus Polarisedimenticolaceae bacterium]|nr:sulfatase [Candidatus Polarisedimenticolaceae bacterium]